MNSPINMFTVREAIYALENAVELKEEMLNQHRQYCKCEKTVETCNSLPAMRYREYRKNATDARLWLYNFTATLPT